MFGGEEHPGMIRLEWVIKTYHRSKMIYFFTIYVLTTQISATVLHISITLFYDDA